MIEDIFEKYQNNEIDIYNTIVHLDKKNDSNDKKNEGVIYTPPYIAQYIIKNLGYKPSKTIVEPSVGHGIFLFSLIEYVKKEFDLKGSDLKEWFETKVYTVDINKKSVEDLKALLRLYFEKELIFNINLDNIKVDDGLFHKYPAHFDFAFGNPPYVRTKNLNESYLKKLKENFNSCEAGNIDLFYAFVEKMNDLADVSSFIVPNSYLFNASCKKLREVLLENIYSVIDFKEELIFDNARTYTSIYKTDKLKKAKTVKYKESLNEDFIEIKKSKMDNKQWLFDKSSEKRTGTPILDLFPCYGSIATLKDKLYLIEEPIIEEINGVPCYRQFYEGVLYYIEQSICIDFIKMTKIDKKYKILYPYNNLTIIPEDEMKKDYPNAYKYLEAIRPILDQRDKGKVEKYDAWYAYGRKQGMQPKQEQHYLIMPLMATEKYVCHHIETKENFLSTSGFALGFNDMDELKRVKSILESGVFFDYIKLKGRPWAGKNPYYSFTKTHLKDFLI